MEPVPEIAPIDASNALQMTEAEPITDAEAEAAMLALGPVLRWWKAYHSDFEREVADAPGSNRRYVVCIYPHGTGWHAEWEELSRGGQTEVHTDASGKVVTFPSDIGAKAACERHHATGRWES